MSRVQSSNVHLGNATRFGENNSMMWPPANTTPAISVDNLSEVSTGTGRTGSTSGRSAFSENLDTLRTLLGIGEEAEVFIDRFRVDRKKLEDMISSDNDSLDATHQYFQKIMDNTGTNIAWPTRLKIGAKNKKDPHVRVAGRCIQDVIQAKECIIATLSIQNNQATLKLNVSYTHHSHIIGEGGQTITRVRQSTGCHVHFPDSNRTFADMKSNQVSITGEISGVEKARAQIRDLVPLIFSFELPILGVLQPSPESSFVQSVSDKYKVHVSYRTRSRFHATLVMVKGKEWEVNKVKEATIILINHLCGDMANQVPVQMTMEISPHHHAIVLGPQSLYLKAIMENTQAQILFPDASDPNIPVLRKNNVTITGHIDDVYRARQQLMGSLPLTLIFTFADAKEPPSRKKIQELSSNLDVSINTRHCPKQNNVSVIIRAVERNIGNVYEAHRQLLDLPAPISVHVPETYMMPNAPKIFSKESSPVGNNCCPMPDFRLPEVRPAFSPVEMQPMPMFSPLPMWKAQAWPMTLLQQQHMLLQPSGSSHPLGLSACSSGYSSHFNNTSPSMENTTAFSNASSSINSSCSMSPTGISLQSSPKKEHNFSNLELGGLGKMNGLDWVEKIVDSPMTPADFDQKKMLAAKAFQNKPTGPEVRTPTATWSGYGLSLSSPSEAFKTCDLFAKRNDFYDSSIWKSNNNNNNNNNSGNKSSLMSSPPGFGIELGSNFLTSSNKLEAVSPSLLNRIQNNQCQDLHTLLTSIGLEKYIKLFASQEIDMASFSTFTEANLLQLGVVAYGPRHKMLLAIAELNKRRSPLLNAAPGAERNRSTGWNHRD